MFIFLVCDNFNIWCFLNLIKPDEVGKPIANETSQQFWHYKEFSSLYLTLIDRKPAFFIIIIWRVTLPFLHYQKPLLKFLIFSKSYFQKHKSSAQSLNFDWIWLVNELVLTFSAPIKCAKAQFNLKILSRVMPHTTYYRQTDRHFRKYRFFWLRGSQNVKIWWKFRKSFFT